MDSIEGVEFRQMDFHDPDAPARLRDWLGGPADGVLSDMAANATGHRKTDQLRIVGLVELAADFAGEVLALGGFFLAKVLQGGAEGDLLARLKRDFATVRHLKPKASRADSAELYLLATGFRGSKEGWSAIDSTGFGSKRPYGARTLRSDDGRHWPRADWRLSRQFRKTGMAI
jgi:23S rRNA (uridine2552-2'-O)-methyltransferase